jgi:hypothetical protein
VWIYSCRAVIVIEGVLKNCMAALDRIAIFLPKRSPRLQDIDNMVKWAEWLLWRGGAGGCLTVEAPRIAVIIIHHGGTGPMRF